MATDYELTLQTAGEGIPSSPHIADIYSLDKDGVYHKFGENQPVWKGMRVVDNGDTTFSYFADDGAGVLLDPPPMLVSQPVVTNEVPNSNNLSLWTISAGSTATFDQIGIDGTSDAATLVTDTLTNSQCNVYQTITGVDLTSSKVSTVVHIKKEDVVTSNASILLGPFNPTYQDHTISINLNTGSFLVPADDTGTLEVSVVLLPGDWWKIVMSVNTDIANDSIYVFITPTIYDLDSIIANITHTGSCIVGNVDVFIGKTFEETKKLLPIITTASPASTDLLENHFAAANHSDSGAQQYQGVVEVTGVDTDVLRIGVEDMLGIKSVPGDNILLNGEFDTDLAGWEVGENGTNPVTWEAPGVCRIISAGDGLSSYIRQTLTVPSGAAKIIFDVVVTTGFLRVYWNSAQQGSNITESGHYESDIIGDGIAKNLHFYAMYNAACNFTMDNVEIRSFAGSEKQLTLSDGTNSVSLPIANGNIPYIVDYNSDAGTMMLTVDGVESAEVPYDGSFGADEIIMACTGRDLLRISS